MTNFKEVLESIIRGELKVVTTEVLDEMIENIGSTDPILRDKLIYTAFWTLIFKDHLDKQQLEYILNKLLTNKSLVMHIYESKSDFVFTRSFTSLVYAATLEYDASKLIIDVDLVRSVMDATHDYMTKEEDLRGYIEHKGWAHAAAHGADLLDSLIKHPVATEEDARKVLQHITRFLTIARGYQDNEEERLAYAFTTLTKHHLSEEILIKWLIQLEKSLADRKANASNGELQAYYAQLAFKNFLKSSYFFLEKEAIHKNLQESIKRLIVGLIL